MFRVPALAYMAPPLRWFNTWFCKIQLSKVQLTVVWSGWSMKIAPAPLAKPVLDEFATVLASNVQDLNSTEIFDAVCLLKLPKHTAPPKDVLVSAVVPLPLSVQFWNIMLLPPVI